MRFIVCIIGVAFSCSIFGQSNYPASAIPVDLLKDADAVVRLHEEVFEVKSRGKAIGTEHEVVTILNEKAASLGTPYFYYYEFEEIVDIEASVYDAQGKLVRNLKKKDIKDVKPLDYFVDDFRYKVLDLPSRNYPYTVEYTVVKEYDGLMFYPDFKPQSNPSIAVEYSSLQVIMPAGIEMRYKEINVPSGCNLGNNKWEFKNLHAFQPPPYSTKESLGLAEVITSPTEFTFGGIDGDMKSWKSFGEFEYNLIKTQQTLPNELKEKLHNMVADCPDEKCKIERVYSYLQDNTRYYYVGLGIGGWQPAAASNVHKNKYGDCKGLSNYTVSMLREVGVPAQYVNIRAGEDEIGSQYPDFPNASFNHIIVCVPLKNDTIWLECTSQSISCGFLGDFTDNRTALMVTPQGGQVIHTPIYDETKNTIKRATKIKINPDGSAILNTANIYTCLSQDYPAHLASLHDEDRKKSLYKTMDVKNFEITAVDFVNYKGRLPSVEQKMELNMPKFASPNGKRFFLPFSVLSSKLEIPISDVNSPNFFKPDSRGYTEEDSITLEIPAGFKLESQLSPQNIETKFGTYFSKVSEVEGKLIVQRKLVMNGIQRPKSDFADFVNFLKAVNKADKSNIVLVKDSVGP